MENLKILVVVDMQNDFIDGSLGSEAAKKIVPNVAKKIRDWDGIVLATCDTHDANYLESQEGEHLPVEHCIENTHGWLYNDEVRDAIAEKDANWQFYGFVTKDTFGAVGLPQAINEIIDEMDSIEDETEIEFIGLDTDICVISNALLAKAYFLDAKMSIDSSCCAGTTPEAHEAALTVAKSCQINVI